jgi:PTS system galactitol-specific IIC component
VVALAAPIVNGNVLRMVIIGTVTLALGFYIATSLAPLFTNAAVAAGFTLPANATQITAIGDGFVWIAWVAVMLASTLGFVGVAVMAALVAGGIVALRRSQNVSEAASGGAQAEVG